MDIYLNGSNIKNKHELFARLNGKLRGLLNEMIKEGAQLSESLDAVYDLLVGANEEVSFHINNAGEMFLDDRRYYDRFLKMLRALSNENDLITYELCEHELTTITERAYAKINLSLDVTGKLDNGYHLVKMIMASISLHDTLTFTKSDTPGIRLTMENREGVLSEEGLSLSDDNLIMKAAKAILTKENLEKHNLNPDTIGIDIKLSKNIPMAAGMAGGSADAAAALRGLNALFDLNLSDDELCKLGVKLGADVPFCVLQGCYLSEGIGEVLTKLPNLYKKYPTASIALIKPPIDVSTKFVYEHLDNDGIDIHPDVDAQIDAINIGDLNKMTDNMRNVLRDVTVPAYPIVLELEEFLKENGAINAMMSGSGPTVYGIFDDRAACEAAVLKAKSQYPEMFTDIVSFI